MAQKALGRIAGEIQELTLPDPSELLMGSIPWGSFDHFFTPAFWAVQAWLDCDQKRFSRFKLGESLEEEVAACLLGGHGIPSEVGLAAFLHLRVKGLITLDVPEADEIASALKEPLTVNNRRIHYRFWNQKSKHLHECLKVLSKEIPSCDSHKSFRDWLVSNLPGVGLKTASWITRNWFSSNEVAIIDIHIQRAGVEAGFIEKSLSVQKDYLKMEDSFLSFASAIQVEPAVLDTLIWRQMKEFGAPLRATTGSSSGQMALFV